MTDQFFLSVGPLLYYWPRKELIAFYARVAEDMRLPLEDDVFNDVLKDNRLKADPIHANAAGYRVVAERLAAFLREAGAL